RCLRAVPFADEIVVFDSGSTDRTVEIARACGARVEITDWPGHVRQKQRAVDAATHDWILALDADEVVSSELAASIRAALADPNPADAYELTRKVFYLGRWIEHCGWYPEWKIRLFDRRKARWGGYDPHDTVECSGRVARLDGDLHHYSYRDVTHHLTRINEYTSIMASELHARGKRSGVFAIIAHPAFTFWKKYVFQLGVLDGVPGFVVCVLAAYYVFLKYLKLWELGRSPARA
ncbi:MAG: glycosyltransferase family 2 protein, partial [Deltaproteobacteria bacterium]|nr:glycosyltransferase family 2 protein [Deltaproteobacteria bacterium]